MDVEYKNTVKSKDKHEYEVTVPYKELKPFEDRAYKKLALTIKIPGFRPGKAPREKIEAQLGAKILVEAINNLLPQAALHVITKEKLRPVNTPDYDLKKTDEKEGIVFTFSIVNYPEVKLGDFSKIKAKKEEPKITQKDIDSVIRSIINTSLKVEEIKELTTVKAPSKSKKDKKDDDNKKSVSDELGEYELNDKLIKKLKYDEEKNLEDMRKTVKGKLTEMKGQQAENDYNNKVIEEAIKLSKIEIPEYFIEKETAAAEKQFAERLKNLKLDMETYLATQGTSLEEKRKEWEEEAKKRVEVDILLINIADQNGTVATDDDVTKEIEAIEDANIRSQYNSQSAREYVRTIVTKQRGMLKLLDMVGTEKKSKK